MTVLLAESPWAAGPPPAAQANGHLVSQDADQCRVDFEIEQFDKLIDILDELGLPENRILARHADLKSPSAVLNRVQRTKWGCVGAVVITVIGVTGLALTDHLHIALGGAVLGAFLAYALGSLTGYEDGYIDSSVRARMLHRLATADGLQQAGQQRELIIELPAPLKGEGFLYVIEFSTGVVKVGQTADPQRRLQEHRRAASTFKVTIVNFWISPAHSNFLVNEIDLISQCMRVSTRTRREYFRDVSFAAAVAFANELTYDIRGGDPR